ncbi:Uncharacterised protein [Yersinia rohdei]|uniref:hypothetical protein n=1 Tax=Yersinia rohdei TaxID=29485 RepID=UPI00061BDE76|nr:hypothetical protein [Yersinia rohdei]CNF22041.1 Uncharacterised protein [Yersinia rohdei]
MGWDRQKPFITEKPSRPSLGRWLLAGLLSIIVGILLFSLHASDKFVGLQTINIWVVSAVPIIGWGLTFCVRGYMYGRNLSHYTFLQDEAQQAQQEWQTWAERYMAVLASCVLLPDVITVSYLANNPTDVEFQRGLVRRIDYLPQDQGTEYQAIMALLVSIQKALNSLPSDIELRATLLTDSDPAEYEQLRAVWTQCWDKAITTRFSPITLTLSAEMSYSNIEDGIKNAITGAELVLVLQLHGDEDYSDGLAVFLLTTDDMAQKHQLPIQGRLLRPMQLNIEQAESELALFMETQSLACRAGGILGDSTELMSLTPKIIPVGHRLGANFSAESVLIQESLTGIPGPFSAWLVAAFGLDFAYYYGVPYVVFSFGPEYGVVGTVSPGVCNEDVE